MSYGTGQEAVMPCGRDSNRRSGVALAVRRRPVSYTHLTLPTTPYV